MEANSSSGVETTATNLAMLFIAIVLMVVMIASIHSGLSFNGMLMGLIQGIGFIVSTITSVIGAAVSLIAWVI
jgi:hypothetical protein